MQQEIDINTSEKYNQEMMKNLFNTLKNISPINKEYEYLLKVPHVDNASIGNGICTYASVSSLINYIARLNGKEFLTATKLYEKYDHEIAHTGISHGSDMSIIGCCALYGYKIKKHTLPDIAKIKNLLKHNRPIVVTFADGTPEGYHTLLLCGIKKATGTKLVLMDPNVNDYVEIDSPVYYAEENKAFAKIDYLSYTRWVSAFY